MARWDRYSGSGFFPASQPLAAKGGIRAQSQHGAFSETWWGKRWLEVLERFDLGARLQRGRRYARAGQVLSIEVGEGTVSASVQGSRPTPYAITMRVKPLPKTEWIKVVETVSSQALFASKLLAGQMPQELEELIRGAGVSLFPERHADLETSCSCPDWSNPCKHIAAVYFLLGEEFDRDPFLILKMRGMSRENFFAALGGVAKHTPKVAPEPLPASPTLFWTTGTIPTDLAGARPESPTGAALPRRLGKFPFWRGTQEFLGSLDVMYVRASAHAAKQLEGE